MRSLLLFFLLVGFSLQLNAQESESTNLEYGKYAIGLSPSALVNFYSGIQVSQDIRILRNLAFTAETAYIFRSNYSNYARGFRIKPGIQYMVLSGRDVGFTVGLNYLLRYTRSDRTFNVNYWQDNYTEIIKTDREKVISAGELTMSLIFRLTDKLRLEIGGGLGAGEIQVNDLSTTQIRDNEDVSLRGFNFNIYDREGQHEFLVTSFNVNFSYVLVE